METIGGLATNFDESETVFADQAAAGIGYRSTPTAILSAEYRYFGTTDPEFESRGTTTETELSSHNFMAGVRFLF